MVKSMDERVRDLEKNDARMGEQISTLVTATKENTVAIKDLTTTLAFNKGIVVASLKSAAVMTAIIGGLWIVATWIANFVQTLKLGGH